MKAAWAREDVMLGAVCYSGLSPESVSPSVACVSCRAESHVHVVQVSALGLICLVLPRGSECMSSRDGWMVCMLLEKFPPQADKHRGVYLAWRSYFLLSLWGAVTVIA